MEKQIINRGYLTYSLTDGNDFVYGLYGTLCYDWEKRGKVYWSEVFVDGNAFSLVRRGEDVTGKAKSELDALVKQSIINLGWQEDLCRQINK